MRCADATCTILPLKAKDAPELAALEAANFSTSWTAEQYAALLRTAPAQAAGEEFLLLGRIGGVPSFLVFGLRCGGGELAAYVSLEVLPGAAEMEIYNIAVQKGCRREGYGRMLLSLVLRAARRGGIGRALLEVREGNSVALGLYASAGFVECGRRKGYYADTGEDALVLCRALDDPGDGRFEKS